MPTLILAKTISLLKGITDQAIKAKVNVIIGANINILLLSWLFTYKVIGKIFNFS